MTARAFPEWAWLGRDRAHVWHIVKLLALDDGAPPVTFCGAPVLNVKRQGSRVNWSGVERCDKCLDLCKP